MYDLYKELKSIRCDRQRSHGDFKANFEKIASLWGAYLGIEVAPADVGFMMSLLKMVRAKQGDITDMDSYLDGANYILLSGEYCKQFDSSTLFGIIKHQADTNTDENFKNCLKFLTKHTEVGGVSPLHIAVKHNKPAMAKALIEAGADVNARDDSGYTPADYVTITNRNAFSFLGNPTIGQGVYLRGRKVSNG